MATTNHPTVPVAQPEPDPWPLDDHPLGIQADEMFARQLDTGFAGEVRNLLNDGKAIDDEKSPTKYVMSPDPDLAKVAAAGRRVGEQYRRLLLSPTGAGSALPYLAAGLGTLVGQGGIYDYQRRGDHITGFTQLPHFRNISNVNFGLVGQQAGLSLDELLKISGRFAKLFSSNSDPKDPYGLDKDTRRYIEVGYEIGRSGAFGPPASFDDKR